MRVRVSPPAPPRPARAPACADPAAPLKRITFRSRPETVRPGRAIRSRPETEAAPGRARPLGARPTAIVGGAETAATRGAQGPPTVYAPATMTAARAGEGGGKSVDNPAQTWPCREFFLFFSWQWYSRRKPCMGPGPWGRLDRRADAAHSARPDCRGSRGGPTAPRARPTRRSPRDRRVADPDPAPPAPLRRGAQYQPGKRCRQE